MKHRSHDLSFYARLWRLNRGKNRLRRLEKYVPLNPPLVSKNLRERYLRHVYLSINSWVQVETGNSIQIYRDL